MQRYLELNELVCTRCPKMDPQNFIEKSEKIDIPPPIKNFKNGSFFSTKWAKIPIFQLFSPIKEVRF
ncbi:hypothetical protein PGABG02_0003900 [Plasmodium sp. DRC-Itaito]|nr:hypothetical protein PGABG02_0003900 [Plasmodium sp. DRC-Itaito]